MKSIHHFREDWFGYSGERFGLVNEEYSSFQRRLVWLLWRTFLIGCINKDGKGKMEQPGLPSSSHEGQGGGAVPPINLPVGRSGYDCDETTSSSSCSSGYSGLRRNKRPRNSKYSHQEDDCEFFDRRFSVAQDALHTLNLGDNFHYPSDKSFKKTFPLLQFSESHENGGLPKFDGTFRGYPGFGSNFYNMVFVQKEHYLTKLLALEYMVPEKVKQALFHGLQNTLQDFGHRIMRLEEEFSGSEHQVQYLVEMLDKARRKGAQLPYIELRELVREVRAHLDRTDAQAGDAEMLVVMLKSLVPQHIKA